MIDNILHLLGPATLMAGTGEVNAGRTVVYSFEDLTHMLLRLSLWSMEYIAILFSFIKNLTQMLQNKELISTVFVLRQMKRICGLDKRS